MTTSLLYIEDDPANVTLVQRLLRSRPEVAVLVATTAADGARRAREEHPNLILLDNRLPDGTGATVLRELMTDERTRSIPVVITSGDSARSMGPQLLALGAAHFLEKPYDIHELLAVIDRHLAPD